MSMIKNLPKIYILHGNFLVFDSKDCLSLRKSRIIGNMIGCSPERPNQICTSSLPYLLSHYAVDVILRNQLASFFILEQRNEMILERNKVSYKQSFAELQDKHRSTFINKREDELKKRGINPCSNPTTEFNPDKMRLPINNEPETCISIHDLREVDIKRVKDIINLDCDKAEVFRDLYNRGYHISCGLKFGADFLVYQGDPVGYHAKYAIRYFDNHNDYIDTIKYDFRQINAWCRLCHTANKTPLLATVSSNELANQKQVAYWTLRPREFLNHNSSGADFERLDEISLSLEEKDNIDGHHPDVYKFMKF